LNHFHLETLLMNKFNLHDQITLKMSRHGKQRYPMLIHVYVILELIDT